VFEETQKQKHVILLVDDNADDVLLVRRAFERAGVGDILHVTKDGLDATAYLTGEPPYLDRFKHPLPALVLLDIKMPIMDGFDVLVWIRRQPQFAKLPVIMLTSSDVIRDVNRAYKLGADSFLVKPLDFWNAADLWRNLHKLLLASSSEKP
jgi:CheY-like chemotaxis protein